MLLLYPHLPTFAPHPSPPPATISSCINASDAYLSCFPWMLPPVALLMIFLSCHALHFPPHNHTILYPLPTCFPKLYLLITVLWCTNVHSLRQQQYLLMIEAPVVRTTTHISPSTLCSFVRQTTGDSVTCVWLREWTTAYHSSHDYAFPIPSSRSYFSPSSAL